MWRVNAPAEAGVRCGEAELELPELVLSAQELWRCGATSARCVNGSTWSCPTCPTYLAQPSRSSTRLMADLSRPTKTS